eukprot:308369_1
MARSPHLQNQQNLEYSLYIDQIYEIAATNISKLFTKSVTEFRLLKWRIRSEKDLITSSNSNDIIESVQGFAKTRATRINQWWGLKNNESFDQDNYVKEIVQKKINNDGYVGQLMSERNNQNNQTKRVKKPKKHKKVKKKKNLTEVL